MWTLVTLLLLSVLATGAFHVALGDAKRSNDAQHLMAVHSAADAGVYAASSLWTGVDLDSVPVGDTLPSAARSIAGVTTVTRALRSSPNTWWITGTAFIPRLHLAAKHCAARGTCHAPGASDPTHRRRIHRP